jgi:CheY-like chemotaxis protein
MSLTRSRPRTTELDASTVDVLVVDDDDAFRDSLLESIHQLGFTAVSAANGAEAVRLAHDRPPRLILLDLQMPVMNGWQFLERRRSDRRLSEVPVIVVSAVGAEVGQRSDVERRLEKPVDEPLLIAALDEVLSRLPPDVAAALPESQAPATVLVIEDDADTQASVVELLEDHGYRVARASNGEEAERILRGGERPDCIVLDLWMPVMNGWTFASRLRQLGGAATPVVVVTAAEPYWGYPVPPTHVMRKPLRSEPFLALISKLLSPQSALAPGRVSKPS